jgi:hypothetical protein
MASQLMLWLYMSEKSQLTKLPLLANKRLISGMATAAIDMHN